MNFEKYTERARGFVQSAQTYAIGQSHQQFSPEHLLKVLLDDPEGLAANRNPHHHHLLVHSHHLQHIWY